MIKIEMIIKEENKLNENLGALLVTSQTKIIEKRSTKGEKEVLEQIKDRLNLEQKVQVTKFRDSSSKLDNLIEELQEYLNSI